MMELWCEKYGEKMEAAGAVCRHPKEYCKVRTACVIHFMGQEGAGAKAAEGPDRAGKPFALRFDKGGGLLPAIAQDFHSGEVLMLAYINEEAWERTLQTGRVHYWSRSRNCLWLKGESSRHYQLVREILVDCDEDTVIFKVEQLGGAACHTGYRSCFFRRVDGQRLQAEGERVFNPEEVYKK